MLKENRKATQRLNRTHKTAYYSHIKIPMSFLSSNASRILFAASGTLSVGSSAYLFRDLADLSQWWLETDRTDVFEVGIVDKSLFCLRKKMFSLTLSLCYFHTDISGSP